MTWELAVCLFGLAGTVCSIFFGYMAFKRNQRTDEQQDGRENGTLLTEIGYIKANTDDIKRKQEKQDGTNGGRGAIHEAGTPPH